LADGDYVFVSRKDHQVKWMGYRIELAEIESNLQAHPQIKDAVAMLVPTENGDLTELAAFFEAEGKVDPAALSRFLRQRLPAYMVPRRFVLVEALPRNDRGKLARAEILKQYLGRNPGEGDGRAC
jgi:acyl-coenzyme A synthetase/AMP-(fatty) acid ligase